MGLTYGLTAIFDKSVAGAGVHHDDSAALPIRLADPAATVTTDPPLAALGEALRRWAPMVPGAAVPAEVSSDDLAWILHNASKTHRLDTFWHRHLTVEPVPAEVEQAARAIGVPLNHAYLAREEYEVDGVRRWPGVHRPPRPRSAPARPVPAPVPAARAPMPGMPGMPG